MTEDHFLQIPYGAKWPLCVDVPLNTYSFILKCPGIIETNKTFIYDFRMMASGTLAVLEIYR